MRGRFRLAAAVLSGLILAGCGAAGDDGRRLVLTGSSTVAPLAGEIARRFETLNPDVRIDVQTGGSARGMQDVRAGTADIGMVSRALGDAERDLTGHVIARDGVGLIVHGDNPVAALDADAVRAIFRGELGHWQTLGGRDAPITVVSKAAGRSTLEVFLQHYGLGGAEIAASVVIGDNQQGIKTVAGDPHAIGYVSIGAAEFAIGQGLPLRLLPADGVAATTANLQSGRFPLSRPLNLVTRGEPGPLARRYIDFARSAEVHDLVRRLYFVPVQQQASLDGHHGVVR